MKNIVAQIRSIQDLKGIIKLKRVVDGFCIIINDTNAEIEGSAPTFGTGIVS